MRVRELIEILKELDQEQEIRYYSYEFLGDFDIEGVEEVEHEGIKYYTIK